MRQTCSNTHIFVLLYVQHAGECVCSFALNTSSGTIGRTHTHNAQRTIVVLAVAAAAAHRAHNYHNRVSESNVRCEWNEATSVNLVWGLTH